MPLYPKNTSSKAKQLSRWKEWDRKANKNGMRASVFTTQGDCYQGEWKDNKKHGKGMMTYAKSGAIYEGEWSNNKRSGFGTYSVPSGDITGNCIQQYVGHWKDGKRHGYGTFYYTDKSHYEGEWRDGQRSGWGRMYFMDESVYEGEWWEDEQYGHGMVRKSNGERYEGRWKDGKRHGAGKYLFSKSGQVMEGVWHDGVAKCGIIRDDERDLALTPTPYPIPKIGVMNHEAVVQESESAIRSQLYTAEESRVFTSSAPPRAMSQQPEAPEPGSNMGPITAGETSMQVAMLQPGMTVSGGDGSRRTTVLEEEGDEEYMQEFERRTEELKQWSLYNTKMRGSISSSSSLCTL